MEKEKPKRRRWRWVLGAVVAVLLILTWMAPKLASIGLVKNAVVASVSAAIAGDLHIDSWSLSWSGPQIIKGIKITGPDAADGDLSIITIERIEASQVSLLSLLGDALNLGDVKLTGVDARIELDANGNTNLDAALAPTSSNKTTSSDNDDSDAPGAISLNLEVIDSRVSIDTPENDPLVITDLSAKVEVASLADITAKLAGSITSGAGPGQITLTAKVSDLFDSQAKAQVDNATFDIDVSVTQLPLATIDGFAQQELKLATILGKALTASIQAQGNGGKFAVTLAAEAEHLTGLQLDAEIDGPQILVKNGAFDQLLVTPATWEQMAALSDGGAPAKLLKPFTVTAEVQSLNLHNGGKGAPLRLIGAQLKLAVGDIELQPEDAQIAPVALRKTSLTIDAPQLSGDIDLQLHALAEQGEHSGRINLDATFARMLDASGQINWEQLTARVAAQLQDVPLVVFDQLLSTGGSIVAAAGPSLQAELDATFDRASGGGSAKLIAQSRYLHVESNTKLDAAGAESAIDLTWNVQPQLLAGTGWRLDRPVALRLAIDDLRIPRNEQGMDFAAAELNAHIRTDDLTLVAESRPKRIDISSTDLTVQSQAIGKMVSLALAATIGDGGNSARITINGTAKDVLDDKQQLNDERLTADARIEIVPAFGSDEDLPAFIAELIQGVIGSQLDATVRLALLPPEGDTGIHANFDLNVAAKNLDVALEGVIEDQHLNLSDRSSASLVLTPTSVRGRLAARGYALTEPTKVTLQVGSLQVPLQGQSMLPSRVAVTAAIDRLAVRADDGVDDLSLRDVTLELAQTAMGQTAITMAGKLVHGNQSGDMSATANIADLFAEPQIEKAAINLKAIPADMVRLIAGDHRQLVGLLGDRIDEIVVELTPEADQTQRFVVRASSPSLTLNAGGKYVPGAQVLIDDGAEAKLNLTNDSIALIQAWRAGPDAKVLGNDPATWTLARPATLRMTLAGTRIGLRKSEEPDSILDLSQSRLAVQITCDDLFLKRQGQSETYHLSKIEADLNASDPSKPIVVNAHTQVIGAKDKQGQSQTSQIVSKTQITGLIDAKGRLDTKAARIKTDTRSDALPTDLIAGLAALDETMVLALGDTVALSITGEYPAGLTGLLESENAKVELTTGIDASRNLILKTNSVSTFKVTEGFSQALLKRLLPLLGDAVASDVPAKITVNQKEFLLPLDQFAMEKIQASGTVELGTLRFRDGGEINKLREWAGHRTGPAEASFTPLKFQLANGILSYRDMVMTMDNIDLRFSGKLNQRPGGRVALTMGMSGRTLSKIQRDLGLVIKADEYLEVPVGGTIDKLDWNRAMGDMLGKIATLAGRAAIKKNVKGVEGQLLDALLGGGKSKRKAQDDEPQTKKDDLLGGLLNILGERQRAKDEKKRRKKNKKND